VRIRLDHAVLARLDVAVIDPLVVERHTDVPARRVDAAEQEVHHLEGVIGLEAELVALRAAVVVVGSRPQRHHAAIDLDLGIGGDAGSVVHLLRQPPHGGGRDGRDLLHRLG
jgi:hypothetical protein